VTSLLLFVTAKFGEITDLVWIFKIITDLVSIFKIITDLVSILHLFLRVHSTGTIFVIYFKIDTRSVNSPQSFLAQTKGGLPIHVQGGKYDATQNFLSMYIPAIKVCVVRTHTLKGDS
jgi:hypothetical protein